MRFKLFLSKHWKSIALVFIALAAAVALGITAPYFLPVGWIHFGMILFGGPLGFGAVVAGMSFAAILLIGTLLNVGTFLSNLISAQAQAVEPVANEINPDTDNEDESLGNAPVAKATKPLSIGDKSLRWLKNNWKLVALIVISVAAAVTFGALTPYAPWLSGFFLGLPWVGPALAPLSVAGLGATVAGIVFAAAFITGALLNAGAFLSNQISLYEAEKTVKYAEAINKKQSEQQPVTGEPAVNQSTAPFFSCKKSTPAEPDSDYYSNQFWS